MRRIQAKAPAPHVQPSSGDIFPRKVKSKLVKIKPALWEKNDEKLKNTVLKKEKRKTFQDTQIFPPSSCPAVGEELIPIVSNWI